MHGFKGERVLMRIHVEEQDKVRGRPLYEVIIELLRKRHLAGATAFQGSMGFGASSVLHKEHVVEIKRDLPVVVECVDTEEKIQAVLPELDDMIGGGLITLERVKVIMYRPHLPEEERDEHWPIHITGSWQTHDR